MRHGCGCFLIPAPNNCLIFKCSHLRQNNNSRGGEMLMIRGLWCNVQLLESKKTCKLGKEGRENNWIIIELLNNKFNKFNKLNNKFNKFNKYWIILIQMGKNDHCKHLVFIIWKFPSEGVLVHSGGYNQVPYSEWLINNKNLFLTVLEAGSWRWRCQREVLVRTCFLARRWFMCPHMLEGVRDLSGVTFMGSLIPFMKVEPVKSPNS